MNTWHFVGYSNMQKFVGRLVPTFSSVTQVVMTGSSAGGLGAGLNFGMVQDAFGKIPVSLVDDSFPPFLGQDDITPCLQAIIKPLWGYDKSLPSDCADCSNADKGGMVNILPYWLHKYPAVRFGLVSSMHDQIIRLWRRVRTTAPTPTRTSFRDSPFKAATCRRSTRVSTTTG